MLLRFPEDARPYILDLCDLTVSGEEFTRGDFTYGRHLVEIGLSVLPGAIRSLLPEIEVAFACYPFPEARCLTVAGGGKAYIGIDNRLFVLLWRIAHYVLCADAVIGDLEMQEKVRSHLETLGKVGALPPFDADRLKSDPNRYHFVAEMVYYMEFFVMFHEIGHVLRSRLCQDPGAPDRLQHMLLGEPTAALAPAGTIAPSLIAAWTNETFCDLFANSALERLLVQNLQAARSERMRLSPREEGEMLRCIGLSLLFHLLDASFLSYLSKQPGSNLERTGSHPPPFFRLAACGVPHHLWNRERRHARFLEPDHDPNSLMALFGRIGWAFDYLTPFYNAALLREAQRVAPELSEADVKDHMWRVEWQTNGIAGAVAASLNAIVTRSPAASELKQLMGLL